MYKYTENSTVIEKIQNDVIYMYIHGQKLAATSSTTVPVFL